MSEDKSNLVVSESPHEVTVSEDNRRISKRARKRRRRRGKGKRKRKISSREWLDKAIKQANEKYGGGKSTLWDAMNEESRKKLEQFTKSIDGTENDRDQDK